MLETHLAGEGSFGKAILLPEWDSEHEDAETPETCQMFSPSHGKLKVRAGRVFVILVVVARFYRMESFPHFISQFSVRAVARKRELGQHGAARRARLVCLVWPASRCSRRDGRHGAEHWIPRKIFPLFVGCVYVRLFWISRGEVMRGLKFYGDGQPGA